MERLTRRIILGAASAFAGGALIATPSVAAAAAGTKATDPALALIAEYDRLWEEVSRTSDLADEIMFAMPEDIRRGPCVVIPEPDPATLSAFHRDLKALLSQYGVAVEASKPRWFESEEDLREYVRTSKFASEQVDAMVAEWRADKERIDGVLDRAGYTERRQQADAILAIANEYSVRVEDVQPRTIEGVIALIELTAFETDPYIVSALAGLRSIAAGDAA